jgi:hypothetical protein
MAEVIAELSPGLKNVTEIVVCLWGREAFEKFREVFRRKMPSRATPCP